MSDAGTAAFLFIDAAWVAWAITWVVMSSGVKRAVRHEPLGSRALHLVPLGVAIFLLLGGRATGPLEHLLLPRAGWMAFAGAALVAAGLGFAVWARLVIGTNWSGLVAVKEAHALVQSGPYALARHPIYTGLLTAVLGTAIAIDAWRGALAFLLTTVSFLRKMRMEEEFMTQTFGADYTAYRGRTAALVPFVW